MYPTHVAAHHLCRLTDGKPLYHLLLHHYLLHRGALPPVEELSALLLLLMDGHAQLLLMLRCREILQLEGGLATGDTCCED